MTILEVKQFVESLDENNLLSFKDVLERQLEIIRLKKRLSELSGGYILKEFKK